MDDVCQLPQPPPGATPLPTAGGNRAYPPQPPPPSPPPPGVNGEYPPPPTPPSPRGVNGAYPPRPLRGNEAYPPPPPRGNGVYPLPPQPVAMPETNSQPLMKYLPEDSIPRHYNNVLKPG